MDDRQITWCATVTNCSNSVSGPKLTSNTWAWALSKAEQDLLEKTVTRMLRWMIGGIRRIAKIRTEEIRTRAGAANIIEKIREARLRWLGYVERKTEEDDV